MTKPVIDAEGIVQTEADRLKQCPWYDMRHSGQIIRKNSRWHLRRILLEAGREATRQ